MGVLLGGASHVLVWPVAEAKADFAQWWLKLAQGDPARPWTQVRLVNESGLTPEKFVERVTRSTP